MKIRILLPAIEDIALGRRFYEARGEGLGDYFMDSLFAEIDSLNLYAGVHVVRFGYHRLIARKNPFWRLLPYRG